MKVYPVPNRCVRDPVTKLPLDDGGLLVGDYDTFWLRRLRDGDVSKLTPAQQEQSRKDAEDRAKADEQRAQEQLAAAQKAEKNAEGAA
ncbi:DUF2635 domain-containing protein [Kozakia baliensis]|uniref:DUF2635 domain-containing protein n=1 Tax=Kozakia baliensis TaxID=153496 RepID=UPI0009F185D0|nr:DUF2635 domain-containing protein [Kozakia baliensis]GBR25578.1 hypothetical protein AA0488_0687 [Kozakia baliensis NRIC 0488]GEL64030.1 hypothetical protein KBA01_13160 [Kozakia baliensis]